LAPFRERAPARDLGSGKVAPDVDEHAEFPDDAFVVADGKIEVDALAIQLHQDRGLDDVHHLLEHPPRSEPRRPEVPEADADVKVLLLVVEGAVPEHERGTLPRVRSPQLQPSAVLADPADLAEEEGWIPEVLQAMGGEDVLDGSVGERQAIRF